MLAKNAQTWESDLAIFKIGKFLFALTTPNFQELFVNKFDSKSCWFKEKRIYDEKTSFGNDLSRKNRR